MNKVTLSNKLSKNVRFASDLRPARLDGVPCLDRRDQRARGGYGQLRDGKTRKLAHVAAIELARIETPQGRQLDHLCGRRTCVT